jgi:hypothetical protein
VVRPGDLLVSRLRPYLRQVALVHPRAVAEHPGRSIVCSPEFYVLASPEPGGSLAYLVPFLLGPHTQAVLAAGQEGGHHPRVPRATLFGLRVPAPVVAARAASSAHLLAALDAAHASLSAWRRAVTPRA